MIVLCTDTKMMDILSPNNFNGIFVWNSTATTMINVSTPHNHWHGVRIYRCTGTSIRNATSMYSRINGIHVENSNDTVVMNVLLIENQINGVNIMNSTGTKMMDVSLINNLNFGIGVKQSTGASMTNILSTRNDDGAMPSSVVFLQKCSNIQIANISISGNNHKLSFLDSTDVLLKASTFSHIVSTLQQLTTDYVDLPSIITLYNAHLILRNCKFAFNSVTSVAAISSNITLEENVSFESNSAVSAAAFIFSRSSVLILSEQCNTVFRNNSVSLHGAAIYIVTEREPVAVGQLLSTGVVQNDIASGTQCFIRVEGERSHSPRLTFINNTAGEGGDILYGGLVVAGYDGDWNCLLSFKNMSDMTNQSSERRITSAPSRVCSCHDHSSPDCLVVVDPTTYTLYPGQTLTVSAAVVGQDFGIVSGDVYTQFMDSENSSVQSDQKRLSYRINDGCAKLSYKAISSCENCKAVLVLTSDEREVSQFLDSVDHQRLNQSWSILQSEPDYHQLILEYIRKLLTVLENGYPVLSYDILDSVIDGFFTVSPAELNITYSLDSATNISNKLNFPQEIYTYPLYINVEFLSCPLGFTLSQSQCNCDQLLRHMPTVQCDIERQSITRAGSVWVGVDGNDTLAGSQYCPLNYCKDESILVTLQDNSTTGPDSQCGYRHSGVLCGGCQPGLSLALGSEQCLHCSNAYISLVLPFALAGLVLVLFIKVLDFTVCQGTINGFIFYANIINANKHLYYNQSDVKPITLFISWFNLDLGIETCFYDGLTAYARTWLQFIFPLYIWCIAGAIIVLASHSKRVAKISGNNGVPVLATLFLLSYAKLFNTIISVLSVTTLYTTQGQRLVWSVDGNVDYLGPKHAPLFAVALAALLFLWLPYTLVLLLGKYLHKINNRLITRYLLKLKPFFDANYAPFHNHHQYWFGVILIVKAVILFSSAIIPSSSTRVLLVSVEMSSFALLYVVMGRTVLQTTLTTLFHTLLAVNIAALNITKLFIPNNMSEITIASYTLIGLVLVQFLGLCLVKSFKLFFPTKEGNGSIFCRERREGAEDDWEPYMLASLQREQESMIDDEDRESHSSRSIESLPTYPLV